MTAARTAVTTNEDLGLSWCRAPQPGRLTLTPRGLQSDPKNRERRQVDGDFAIFVRHEVGDVDTSPVPSASPAAVLFDKSYLEDLRGALETNTDRARRLLTKMLGKVALRRDGARLLAHVG